MKAPRTAIIAILSIFVAVAAANLVAGDALAAALPVMSNHGTGALTSVELIPQVWSTNPDGANPDYSMAELQAVTDHLAQSQYSASLSQYGFTGPITVDPIRGSLHDRVNCEPRNPGSHTNSVILAAWLACDWVNGTGGSYGHLPTPNGHRVYVIFAPEGTTVTDPGNTNGCGERLGYHSFLPYFNVKDGYYIVIPLHCARDLADVTNVLSHEIAETITDPNLSGWYGSNNLESEVSDVCDSTGVPPYTLDGLTVDTYWSNADNTCVAGGAHGLVIQSLKVTTVGSTAMATAVVGNNGSSSVTVPSLELRGTGATTSSGAAAAPLNFSAASKVTIAPGATYTYTGSVTISASGSYTFWMSEGTTVKLLFGVPIAMYSEIPGSGTEAGGSCRSGGILIGGHAMINCAVPAMPSL
ncbi:MAG TPA: hypothetical protein VG815_08645 [Chloroflexota bacterium]|jgi:hypothetical protein|nr:hypothetical protein [Chloroflexota bacterium]